MSPHLAPRRQRRLDLPALGAVALLAATALGATIVALLVLFVHRTVPLELADDAVDVAGVRYQVPNAWELKPRLPDNARIVAGLPASARRARDGSLLYATFLSARNLTGAPRATARRIELRDVRGRTYAPLPLGRRNPFAYRAVALPAHAGMPAPSSTAGADMVAEGRALVFRIPRRSYEDGPLQLLVHSGATVRELQA